MHRRLQSERKMQGEGAELSEGQTVQDQVLTAKTAAREEAEAKPNWVTQFLYR